MGHLHRYQIIMKNPPVVYGGSLNRIDFNEWKEDKGFVHCTYDGKLEYKFVKVNAKKFLDLEYNIENENNPEEYVLNDLKSKQAELQDAIVRISVTLSEKNKADYSVKNITDFLNEHCSFIQGSTSPHIIKDEALPKGEYSEYMSSIEMVKRYCESSMRIENKTMFLKLAEEIIKESSPKIRSNT
jgi:DNA repair protein SbcD/Mre11